MAMVELLLAHGANVDARRDRQDTPLLMATDNNDVPVVAMLVKYGADLELGGLSVTTGMAGDAVVVGANSSVQVNGTVDTQAMGANALVANGGTNINVGGGSSGAVIQPSSCTRSSIRCARPILR